MSKYLKYIQSDINDGFSYLKAGVNNIISSVLIGEHIKIKIPEGITTIEEILVLFEICNPDITGAKINDYAQIYFKDKAIELKFDEVSYTCEFNLLEDDQLQNNGL